MKPSKGLLPCPWIFCAVLATKPRPSMNNLRKRRRPPYARRVPFRFCLSVNTDKAEKQRSLQRLGAPPPSALKAGRRDPARRRDTPRPRTGCYLGIACRASRLRAAVVRACAQGKRQVTVLCSDPEFRTSDKKFRRMAKQCGYAFRHIRAFIKKYLNFF
jgi:hypothetical protein